MYYMQIFSLKTGLCLSVRLRRLGVDPSLPELHAPSLSLRSGDFAIHV